MKDVVPMVHFEASGSSYNRYVAMSYLCGRELGSLPVCCIEQHGPAKWTP
jgi:hypothetical protein